MALEAANMMIPEDESGVMPGFGPKGGLGTINPMQLEMGVQKLNSVNLDDPFSIMDEYRRRTEPEFAAAKREHDAARAAIQNFRAPIDRGLPWLQAAAGFFSPSRTGRFTENLGMGIKGYSDMSAAQNREEVDAAQRMAQLNLSGAQQGVSDVLNKQGAELRAITSLAALERAKRALSKDPDLLSMYKWANDPSIPPEERTKRQRFFEQRYSSTAIKNAGAMTDQPAISAAVAQQVNAPLWAQSMKVAERMFPADAFEGVPVETRNAMISSKALELFNKTPKGVGAAAPPMPVPITGDARQPAIPGKEPSPAEPTDIPDEGPFAKYMVQPQAKKLAPGILPGSADKAAMKTSGAEDVKTVNTYLEKEVYPSISVADEIRTNATIAKDVLRRNPNLTGAGTPMLAQLGNIMMTLGVAPENVKHFVNDTEVFRSQALLQVLAKQLAQKGVQTESDAMRMMQAGIDPSKPADANKFLIRYMEASADRMYERAKFFENWRKKFGDMRGSTDAWGRFNSENPIVKMIDGKIHFRKQSG